MMLEFILITIIALLLGFIAGQYSKPMKSIKTVVEPKKEVKNNKAKHSFSETPLEVMTDEEIKKEREFRTGYLNILNYDGTEDSQVNDIG